jgi:hypothetical protein
MQSKYGIQGKIRPLTKPGRLCRLRRRSVDGPEQYCCDLLIHRDFCGTQGSKALDAALGTLAGIELMHRLKKRQLMVEAGDEGLTAAEPLYSLAA